MGQGISSVVDMVSYAGALRRAVKQAPTPETAQKIQRSAAELEKTALTRVGMGQGRPLLALNPRATLRHLMQQRRPLYEEVATITVRTDGRSPQEVADEVLAGLAT